MKLILETPKGTCLFLFNSLQLLKCNLIAVHVYFWDVFE